MAATDDAVFSQWKPVLERLADAKSLARRDVEIIPWGEGAFFVRQKGRLLVIMDPHTSRGPCFQVITGGNVVTDLAASNDDQTLVLTRAFRTVASEHRRRIEGTRELN